MGAWRAGKGRDGNMIGREGKCVCIGIESICIYIYLPGWRKYGGVRRSRS